MPTSSRWTRRWRLAFARAFGVPRKERPGGNRLTPRAVSGFWTDPARSPAFTRRLSTDFSFSCPLSTVTFLAKRARWTATPLALIPPKLPISSVFLFPLPITRTVDAEFIDHHQHRRLRHQTS